MGKPLRIYLAITAIPFALAAIFYASLLVWDPLDLRPWSSAKPDLDARNYPLAIRPIVAPAQLAQGHELVWAGTSTTLRVNSEMLEGLADGGTSTNVTQAGQTPTDGRVLFLSAAGSPGLQHLVLEIAEIWRRPYLGRSPFGQRTVEALSPGWRQMPELNHEILEAIYHDAQGGTFYIDAWAEEGALLIPNPDAALSDWQRDLVVEAQGGYDRSTYFTDFAGADCDRYEYLLTTLDEVFAIAKRRGVRVDIIFPPMPYASYPFLWKTIGDNSGHADLIRMQSCVVDMVARENSDKITAHAVHTDPQIVGTTDGMIDPFHFSDPAILQRLVDHIEKRDRLLTPDNFAAENRSLSEGIEASAAGR